MFGIIISLMLLVVIVIFYNKNIKTEWNNGLYVFLQIIPSIILGIIFIANIVIYFDVIGNEASMQVIDEKINVLNKRVDLTLNQLKVEINSYTKYEQNTFNNLKPENVSTLLFVYPQLRSVENVNRLIESIQDLNDKISFLEQDKLDIKRDLIVYSNSFFWTPVNKEYLK